MVQSKTDSENNLKKIHKVETKAKFRPDKNRLKEISQQCVDMIHNGESLDDFEEYYEDAPRERGKRHF